MIINEELMDLAKMNFVFLKRKYAYHVLVLFGIIMWSIVLTIPFQGAPLLNKYELSLFFFLLILIDFLLTALWVRGVCAISSDKATILPNHRFGKYKYFLWLIFFDLKSTILIIPALIISFFIMIKVKLLIGLIAIVFFCLFLMCVELWFLNLYFMIERLTPKLRDKIINISMVIILIGSLGVLSSDEKVISSLPVIGWAGNGILNAIRGDLSSALSYSLLLILISSVGFFLGLKLVKIQINKSSCETLR